MVAHRDAHRGEAGGDLAVLPCMAAFARAARELLELAVAAGKPRIVGGEGLARPEQRAQLGGRQRGEQRPAARRRDRGQAHAHVRDQGGSPRRTLLDHVDDVAPGQDREVRRLPHAVDQTREHGRAQPGEGLVAGVSGAQLVGGDAHAVPALLGEVHHVAVRDHDGELPVERRARDAKRGRERRRGHRTALTREVGEQREGVVDGGSGCRGGCGRPAGRRRLGHDPSLTYETAGVRKRTGSHPGGPSMDP